jgi:hypothetical protein
MADIKTVFETTVAFQKHRHANPDLYKGWSWCVTDFNGICGRIQEGWDIRIAGDAKAGKTSFMVSQAMSSMKEGAKIFYLGNEETDEQLMLRMITNHTNIERNKFRDLAMADGDWELVDNSQERFYQFEGELEYGITFLSEIQERVKAMSDLDMLFLDGQGQLEVAARYDSMAQMQGAISRGIKLLTLPDKKNGKVVMTHEGVRENRKKPLIVVTAVHLNEEGKALWTRGVGRDADVYIRILPFKDPTGTEAPNKRNMEVTLSRHGGAGNNVKVYINGALSQVAGIYEEKVDINKVAESLLTQPKSWRSNG